MFFKHESEGRNGIETEQICDLGKRFVFTDQLFRFVNLQFKVRLIDAFARLFTEEGTKPRRAVVQFVTQIRKGEFAIYLRAQNTHDLVLQFRGIGDLGYEKFLLQGFLLRVTE